MTGKPRFSPLPWIAVVLAGCAAQPARDGGEIVLRRPEPLMTGQEQLDQLCSRPSRDRVTDVFCEQEPPEITGFMELREAMGVASNENVLERGFAINGHSTSLVHRGVSAINPRVIFIQPELEGQQLMSLAFARGERFSEIAVRNRVLGELQFYLVVFTLPCDDTPEGCSPGDLLTEATESGWTSVDVYGEEDLVNTPKDCRVCHQPGGPGTRKILRMQELEPPWNHWFYRYSEGGNALFDDFAAARGDETYAGIPAGRILTSNPGLLSSAIFLAESLPQPNVFVSERIQAEVVRSAAAMGGQQPRDNSVPGESESWQELYDRSKRGEAITVPYHDVKITDADKLAAMTRAYTDYREGLLEREDLPDIRQVLPDDEERLARMGFVTEPGLSGEDVLLQACAQCHNRRMDQTVSRSLFDVDLSSVDREARQRAVARIQLPIDDPAVMPPRLFRRLTDEGRERLIELLEE